MNKIFLYSILILAIISCKSPEARKPISVSSGSFINESIERNKKLFAAEQKSIEKLMQENPEHNYTTSPNGFWYYYNSKIETDSLFTPNFGDIVNFNYNIKALNGSVIYTEEELKAQNYAMDQQELFSGLREGLKLMKSGETVTFLFPSQKGYGYYGDEDRIGANVPLICRVTVNSIIKKQ